MILVDTSVWVNHLRRGSETLSGLLTENEVLCHRFVIGELACGNLESRAEILSLLEALPEAEPVQHQEALTFVEANRLMGAGLGWIDVHLLASAILTRATLWTLDRSLQRAAARLGVAASV